MNTVEEIADPSYCRVKSQQTREQLFGTAPLTDIWLALEYPNPPGDKALKESTLPDEVKTHLASLQKQIPNARLVLIRNAQTASNPRPSFFIAYANRQEPCLYEIQLDSYEQLSEITAVSISKDRFALSHQTLSRPIFLVCTNGKRDRCCAAWGLPVFNALTSDPVFRVYQTSHVGGHRFAANLICLPHGIYYGRLTAQDSPSVAAKALQGRISLDHYRGYAHYAGPVQAAEYFLRRQTNNDSMDAYHLEQISTGEETPDEWEVIFSGAAPGTIYRVRLTIDTSDQLIFESCSTPTQLKPLKSFRLLDISEITQIPKNPSQ